MKANRIILPLLVFFICLSSLNGAERVALVIGNGSYQHSSRLDNPVNDGSDIASALKGCGFEVISGGCASDLSYEAMSKKLAEFKTASAQAKVALFFFAGHGLEVEGSNYLLPVDAQIEENFQVKHRALALDEVLESMAGEDRLKIVILDCCRNNPLGRSWGRSGAGGLAAPTSTPGGTILLYATAPGKTAEDGSGRNSPFSAVLKEAIKTPGSNIESVFKKVGAQVKLNTRTQEPWMNSSYYGEFAFLMQNATQIRPVNAGLPISAFRDSMTIRVEGKERKLPRISEMELSKMRVFYPEIRKANRAYRLVLSRDDLGRKIQGVNFEAQNRLGGDMGIYQADTGRISMGRFSASKSEWRSSGIAKDVFCIPQTYFAPAQRGGLSGYQFGASGKYLYLLSSGNSVNWTSMKEDAWLMVRDLGSSVRLTDPVYYISAQAYLSPSNLSLPVEDMEAVIVFGSP